MKVSFPNMGNSWPAFKTFFECMGAEVILPDPTNRNDVNYLFVPRYVAEVKEAYFCPKLLSLPDVIKILPEVPKILNFEVNVKEFPIATSAIELGKELGKN